MTAPDDPRYRHPDEDPYRSTGNVYGTPQSGPPQQPYGQPSGPPQQHYNYEQPQQQGWGPGPQQHYGQDPHAQPAPGTYRPWPPPAPKKKSGAKTALIIGAILVGLCVVGSVLAAINGSNDPAGTKTSAAADAGHEITFEATAKTGSILSVNWSTVEDSAIKQSPASPWKKTVKLDNAYGLTGVNVSGSGTVTCKLIVDGKTVDEGESAGVVNCSTTLKP